MAETTAYVAHARMVDTQIAGMWDRYWKAMNPGDAAMKKAKEFQREDDKRMNTPEYSAWRGEAYADSKDHAWRIAQAAEFTEKAYAAYAVAEPLAKVAREYDAEHYKGWQRFFLVDHIHSSQHCSSFRPTTRVGWLPDVSGLTEAEAVAEYGAVMCTICFPSAPVEWTSGQLKVAGVCPGSGTSIYDVSEKRTGYYSGNYAECPECGKYVGMSSKALKIPKHKPTVED